MMWYWGSGIHWWGWLVGVLFMLVFWGLVAWAIWYLVSAFTRHPEQAQRPGDPKRILDERLAHGEIDAEEYGRLRALMRDDADAGDGQTAVGTGGKR